MDPIILLILQWLFQTLLIKDIQAQFPHCQLGGVGGVSLFFFLITIGIQYNTHATVNYPHSKDWAELR